MKSAIPKRRKKGYIPSREGRCLPEENSVCLINKICGGLLLPSHTTGDTIECMRKNKKYARVLFDGRLKNATYDKQRLL